MIGVFDSGVGGLSVLRALRAHAPHLDVVYFGDTENAPYGPKSAEEIAQLIAITLRRLYAEGVTDIVSACNSASVSVATVPIDLLRIGVFNIIEMVEPTVRELARREGPIGIFGTEATVRSGIYQSACKDAGIEAVAIALPSLAHLIERGAPRTELQRAIGEGVDRALAYGVRTIALSCTHYPFVRDVFEESLHERGSTVRIFDPSDAVAHEVATRFGTAGEGKLRFLISKESPVFRTYVQKLFPDAAHAVEIARPIFHALGSV